MSLMINGMDMPRNKGLFYDLLLSLSFDGSGKIFFNGKSYPITEIPTHHGRLIDADRLIEYINKELKGDEYIQRMFRRIVKSRPTIIEAEE